MRDADFEEISKRCSAHRIRRKARLISRQYDEALRPSGLKVTQFSLMVAIETQKHGSISELAEAMGLERTTLTRNLSVLQNLGFVEPKPDQSGRSRQMQLTAKGLQALEVAFPYWQDVQLKIESDEASLVI